MEMEKMRVAITGGCGFVGAHVADELMKMGHDVVVMDKQQPRWHPTAMFHELDITDRLQCLQAFQGFQVVYHLAAMANTQMAVNDPWLCTQINCVGTVNVLDGCKNAGVERVIIAGSTLTSSLQNHTSTDGMILDETDAVWPLNSDHPYVTSKLFEEMIARDYMKQYGLPVTIFRYGIQYGPRMTPGVVVHSFIERALRGQELTVHGDGEQWRQYVHVKDVARAHALVLGNSWDKTEGKTYNLVSPRKVTINDIAEAVNKVLPVGVVHGPAREGDIVPHAVSARAAEDDMGWKAEIDLEDGIASTIDWYRKNTSNGMRRK